MTREYINIEKATGMEQDDLMYTIGEVMNYLKAGRDELVVFARVINVEREIFGEREKYHMEFVQTLFLQGFIIRNIALVLFVLSFLYIFLKDTPSKRYLASSLS